MQVCKIGTRILIFVLMLVGMGLLTATPCMAEEIYYSTEWIGSEELLRELAWEQVNGRNASGQRYQFTFNHHTRIEGSDRVPIYCINYYKKGPKNFSGYDEEVVVNYNVPDTVKKGFIELLKNGYPNVSRPYGTQSNAEAYYATAAAVHIWSIYYDIDVLGAKKLGWFNNTGGFSLEIKDLQKYIETYTTAHTTSGTHVMQAKGNEASKRTWVAAMQLLINAVQPKEEFAELEIWQRGEVTVQEGYYQVPLTIRNSKAEYWTVALEQQVDGAYFSVATGTENYEEIVLYIPITKDNAERIFTLRGTVYGKGAWAESNFYISKSADENFQDMFFLNVNETMFSEAKQLEIQTPTHEKKLYYDLNYSGSNYINEMTPLNNTDFMGQPLYIADDLNYEISYMGDMWKDDVPSVLITKCDDTTASFKIATNLNGSLDEGYKDDENVLYLSYWIYTDQKDVELQWKFEGTNKTSATHKIEKERWVYCTALLPKQGKNSRFLEVYINKESNCYISQLMVREITASTVYRRENAPIASPVEEVFFCGIPLKQLYGGNIPVRSGYYFVGWNTKNDGSGNYVTEDMVAAPGDLVVYAIWNEEPTYEVRFHYKNHVNGQLYTADGDCHDDEQGIYTIRVKNKETIKLTQLVSADNWEFCGWTQKEIQNANEEVLEEFVVDEVTIQDGDVDLYGNFSKEIKINYHYYDELEKKSCVETTEALIAYNGKSPLGVFVLKGYGLKTDLSIPSIQGYEFFGWNLSKTMAGDMYEAQQYFRTTETVDLYAFYKKDVNVSFYDTRQTGNAGHQSTNQLHKRESGELVLRYDGVLIPACVVIPSDICEKKDWEFKGFALEKVTSAEIQLHPEKLGTTIAIYEEQNYYAQYRQEVVAKFFDYDFEESQEHLEYETKVERLCSYVGLVKEPKLYFPFSCLNQNREADAEGSDDWNTRDEAWKMQGWSEDTEDSKQYKENGWIKLTENKLFYASYEKPIAITFYEAQLKEEAPLLSEITDMELLGTKLLEKKENAKARFQVDTYTDYSTVYMDSAGKITPAKVVVPEGKAIEEKSGIWNVRGWSENVSANSQIQLQPGECIEVWDNKNYYCSYEKNIELRCVDYNPQTQISHTHLSCEDVAYLSYDGLIQKASFQLPVGCQRFIWSFYRWVIDNSRLEGVVSQDELLSFEKNDVLYLEQSYCLNGETFCPVQATFYDYNGEEARSRSIQRKIYRDSSGEITYPRISVFSAADYLDWITSGWWTTNETFTGTVQTGESVILTTDQVFYALYDKPVVLKYDLNGGSQGCPDKRIGTKRFHSLGMTAIPQFNVFGTPSYEGYEFKGYWTSTSQDTGVQYYNGRTYGFSEDTTLYAQWTPVGNGAKDLRIRGISKELLHTLEAYSVWNNDEYRRALEESLEKSDFSEGDVYSYTYEQRKDFR